MNDPIKHPYRLDTEIDNTIAALQTLRASQHNADDPVFARSYLESIEKVAMQLADQAAHVQTLVSEGAAGAAGEDPRFHRSHIKTADGLLELATAPLEVVRAHYDRLGLRKTVINFKLHGPEVPRQVVYDTDGSIVTVEKDEATRAALEVEVKDVLFDMMACQRTLTSTKDGIAVLLGEK
jgi:hypothetical protein